jgi:hypothetical protein
MGYFFVPCYSIWTNGVEKRIENLTYVPIWNLVDKSLKINDNNLIYQLCFSRIIYQFILLTFIIGGLYLFCIKAEKCG